MTDIVIRELTSREELRSTFALIQQLNPEVDEPLFLRRLDEMLLEGGYRCIASYQGGRMVGVAGFWTGTHLWCGKYVEPDNVVVDRAQRGGGIGGLMMDWIEAEAYRLGCEILKLEAYAERTRTRDFYRRKGFGEPGIVMVKPLPVQGAQTFEQILAKGRS